MESEFQQLIEHEAYLMKDARVIRAKKLKQREEEEIERRDRIKQEMKGKNGIIIMVPGILVGNIVPGILVGNIVPSTGNVGGKYSAEFQIFIVASYIYTCSYYN